MLFNTNNIIHFKILCLTKISDQKEETSCAIAGEEVHITLDQPFVYMIIDNSTGLPLYMGVCNDIVE